MIKSATQIGSPCRKCSATLRYVSNNNCVACLLARKKATRLRAAEKFKNCGATKEAHLKQKRIRDKRRYHRGLKYGLSEEQLSELINQSNGICAICKETNEYLLIDHCHDTGIVRGMLCDFCNKGIGWMRENIDALQTAINYLQSGKNNKKPASE